MCVRDMKGFLEMVKDDTGEKVEEWHRRRDGGREGERVLCESYVQTEEHRCISPWNPNPQMHRRTTAFINNIQTQLRWLEKQ